MPIKNKDGSIYKLQGPNPLMDSQNIEKEKLILHNLTPEEVTGEDPSRQYREIPNPFRIDKIDQFIETEPSEISPEPEPIKEPPKTISNKLVAWCLPATIREEVNHLYGEVKRSIVYGDKFSFETVVVSRGIMACEFLTQVKIDKQSIIYLWDQREWWRVTEVKQQQNDWIITCYPSDHHPSF